MKKLLAAFALVVFLGGVSAPAVASTHTALVTISLHEKDPKKSDEKKSDKSSDAKAEKKCNSEKKGDCTKKCEGKSESK